VPKLTKKALLKHLTKSDKEDIIGEVMTLFDKFKNVKEFYGAELSGEVNPLLEKYKKKITQAYSSANPKERRTNLNINRLITEFKKITIYDRELSDLLLHRVECGVAAFNRNTNRSNTFYNCILNSFGEAINTISSDSSESEFTERIEQIIKSSASGKFEFQKRINELAKGI